MKPLTITIPDYSDEPVTLRCTHEKMWPPPLMTLSLDIEAMWTGGEISQHDYQQIETWKRVCGLLKMGDKCAGCKLAKLQKPRIGHEHHGRVDLVPLGDAIRNAIKARNKAAALERGATPTPDPTAEPEMFEGDTEEFHDETIEVEKPDYPIQGDGNGHEETFDAEPHVGVDLSSKGDFTATATGHLEREDFVLDDVKVEHNAPAAPNEELDSLLEKLDGD